MKNSTIPYVKMREFMQSGTNSKSEARNFKQILMTNVSNPKQNNLIFEHSNLGFRYCLGFRISILGFSRATARLILR
jgi:hypothetical protein